MTKCLTVTGIYGFSDLSGLRIGCVFLLALLACLYAFQHRGGAPALVLELTKKTVWGVIGKLQSMKTKLGRFLGAVLALLALALPQAARADITLDYGAATNTVGVFATAVQSSGTIMIPVCVGVILLCAGIGVYYRFSAKAKIRS